MLDNPYESIARAFSYSPKALPFEGLVTESTGWKVSYLSDVFSKTFEGYSNVPFTTDSRFTCKIDFHITPHPGCVCGFHAYYEKNTAIFNLERWRPLLLLEVEFYGDIIQYSKGLRASEQVIKSLHLPSRCGFGICRNSTHGLSKKRRYFRPACHKHLNKDGFSIPELTMALDIPVSLII